MRRLLLFLAHFVLIAGPIGASERFLLPVVTLQPIPGAFGSLWQSRISVLNSGTVPVAIRGYIQAPSGCTLPPCSFAMTPGGITFYPVFSVAGSAADDGSPARFLILDDENAHVRINLRIQDLSRQSLTWGTDIPVIRESRFTSDTLTLLDLPSEARFRWTLRIYGADAVRDPVVRVRYYEAFPDVRSPVDPLGGAQPKVDSLVAEQMISLRTFMREDEGTHSYAAIDTFSAPAATMSVRRLRIDITPISPDARIWAFASVTNNETQHVTVHTPE